MIDRHSVRVVAVLGVIACVATASCAVAQVVPPSKEDWKLHDGRTVRVKPYAFGYRDMFLQRRKGKICINGQPVKDPFSSVLLQKVCDGHGVPLQDAEQLEKLLAKQPRAQLVLPYYTLKYHDDTGRAQELPTVLLAAEEIQELRPVFEQWMVQEQQRHAEQLRLSQEQRNQQLQLQMQQQELQAQRDMEQAIRRQAVAIERQTEEQRRLREKLR